MGERREGRRDGLRERGREKGWEEGGRDGHLYCIDQQSQKENLLMYVVQMEGPGKKMFGECGRRGVKVGGMYIRRHYTNH